MTDRRKYAGTVMCNRKDWMLIYEKEPGEVVLLTFSGSWRPNRNWGTVDYRGNPNYPAPSSYRGPGKPEGCMLIKTGEGNIHSTSALPFKIGADVVGSIYLVCNDESTGLSDNTGSIDYVIQSDLI